MCVPKKESWRQGVSEGAASYRGRIGDWEYVDNAEMARLAENPILPAEHQRPD